MEKEQKQTLVPLCEKSLCSIGSIQKKSLRDVFLSLPQNTVACPDEAKNLERHILQMGRGLQELGTLQHFALGRAGHRYRFRG